MNVVAMLIGTLFPDSDKKGTLIGSIIPMWIVTKHRRFTHGIMALIVFSMVVYIIWKEQAALSFATGYAVHLLMDSFTRSSIPMFKRKKKRAR